MDDNTLRQRKYQLAGSLEPRPVWNKLLGWGLLFFRYDSGKRPVSSARLRISIRPKKMAVPSYGAILIFAADRVRFWGHDRSEEHTSELQSLAYLVCRLLLEKKKNTKTRRYRV